MARTPPARSAAVRRVQAAVVDLRPALIALLAACSVALGVATAQASRGGTLLAAGLLLGFGVMAYRRSQQGSVRLVRKDRFGRWLN